jgi:hypothetical protein
VPNVETVEMQASSVPSARTRSGTATAPPGGISPVPANAGAG